MFVRCRAEMRGGLCAASLQELMIDRRTSEGYGTIWYGEKVEGKPDTRVELIPVMSAACRPQLMAARPHRWLERLTGRFRALIVAQEGMDPRFGGVWGQSSAGRAGKDDGEGSWRMLGKWN